jgi:hypothetical protein
MSYRPAFRAPIRRGAQVVSADGAEAVAGANATSSETTKLNEGKQTERRAKQPIRNDDEMKIAGC